MSDQDLCSTPLRRRPTLATVRRACRFATQRQWDCSAPNALPQSRRRRRFPTRVTGPRGRWVQAPYRLVFLRLLLGVVKAPHAELKASDGTNSGHILTLVRSLDRGTVPSFREHIPNLVSSKKSRCGTKDGGSPVRCRGGSLVRPWVARSGGGENRHERPGCVRARPRGHVRRRARRCPLAGCLGPDRRGVRRQGQSPLRRRRPEGRRPGPLRGIYRRGQRREDLEREYLANYYRIDEAVPRMRQLRDGDLVHMRDLYTVGELKSSAAYNEALRLGSCQDSVKVRLHGPDGSRIAWNLGDPADSDGWGASRIAMVRRLAPHVRQFVSVRQALVRAEARTATVTGLLDNSRVGVVHLDRRGRILEVNDRARDILRNGDGLSDRDGTLRARAPADQARLERLLGGALPAFNAPPVSGSIVLRRSSVVPPFVVHVKPVAAPQPDYAARHVAALVLIAEPGRRRRIDPEVVAATLELTPSPGLTFPVQLPGHAGNPVRREYRGHCFCGPGGPPGAHRRLRAGWLDQLPVRPVDRERVHDRLDHDAVGYPGPTHCGGGREVRGGRRTAAGDSGKRRPASTTSGTWRRRSATSRRWRRERPAAWWDGSTPTWWPPPT